MGARIRVSSPLEERIRSFANEAEIALLLLTPALDKVLFVNNAYGALFGTPLEESSIADWPRLAHPEDAPAVEAAIAAAGRGELPQALRFRLVAAGPPRHVSAKLVTVPRPDGRGHDIGAIARDATQEQELLASVEHRERTLRQIAEHADSIFWLADPSGRFRYLSPAFERIVGESTGAAWAQRIHPEDRERVLRTRAEAFAAGRAWSAQYRLFDAHGRERVLDARGFPVREQDGRVSSYVGVAHDITELHAAEQKLRELHEFRTQLVNNVAHDLRNPLTTIGLQLELLRRESDPRQEPAFLRMQRSLDHLHALVRDLSAVALLQAGELAIHRAEVDLARLVREVVDANEPVAAGAHVALRARGVGSMRAHADPERVVQVLQNLIGNALKFTPAGGEILVDVTRADGHARIEVRDTGAGFDPALTEHLFRPFTQIHADRGSKRGSGLGLYIAQGIVRAHGGEIGAHSDGPGTGARFWFTLPLEGRP